MSKSEQMPGRGKVGQIDYPTISTLTGKSIASLHQDHTRGNLDIENLPSVAIFLARHGTPELKTAMYLAMTERDLDLSVASRKRDAFIAKRSQTRMTKSGDAGN